MDRKWGQEGSQNGPKICPCQAVSVLGGDEDNFEGKLHGCWTEVMQKWDRCCCEMLSPIAGRDAGGQEQVKSRSRAGQDGVKMGQDGSRCQEGDAKVDREN